jgi:four helix bundle protein
MQDYKKLIVWKKAHMLVLDVYKLTNAFPKSEMFNLRSQLRRASASIPTNIAEGCGKFTRKSFANYLQDAFGSSQEVEYLAFLSRELNYLTDEEYNTVDANINEVKAMLIALVKKIRAAD